MDCRQPRLLRRRPSRRLPRRPADDRVRLVRHVERRPPGAVTVLRELEVPSLAVEAGDDRAQPGPCVEPPVETRTWVLRASRKCRTPDQDAIAVWAKRKILARSYRSQGASSSGKPSTATPSLASWAESSAASRSSLAVCSLATSSTLRLAPSRRRAWPARAAPACGAAQKGPQRSSLRRLLPSSACGQRLHRLHH